MRAEGTPVPIPNTTVKIRAADGTMLETAWESRRLPDIFYEKPFQARVRKDAAARRLFQYITCFACDERSGAKTKVLFPDADGVQNARMHIPGMCGPYLEN